MTSSLRPAFAVCVPLASGTRTFTGQYSPRQPRFMCLHRVQVCATLSSSDSARGEAVAKGQASPLPERARELVLAQLKRPIYAVEKPELPSAARAAQLERPPRFLTDNECVALVGGKAAVRLRDRCSDVVRAAREHVLLESPGIEEEGGALWPEFRALACWRDLENFVRVVSYGCCARTPTGERIAFLDPEGCSIMDQIYTALEVPRKEMVLGVTAAKDFALANVMQDLDADDQASCAAAFDEMISVLQSMPGKQ